MIHNRAPTGVCREVILPVRLRKDRDVRQRLIDLLLPAVCTSSSNRGRWGLASEA